jgi:hypothetical protein
MLADRVSRDFKPLGKLIHAQAQLVRPKQLQQLFLPFTHCI